MKKKYTGVLFLVFSLALVAQTWAQSISGKVVDEYNEALPGVAVLVVGSGKGIATDFNGAYSITGLKAGEVSVEFTFIGYKKLVKKVKLGTGNTILNVQMQVETNELDEVVVVGYGVQRKRELTGSIVSLKAKELTDLPAPSFENAIQGKAAGVQVITGSGIAGSGSVVRVRGVASISAGGDPLYVVDGVPITQDYFLNGNRGGFNTNPLATINPNDIESVEILKDAAATGIYGSRGSNGVILITTKRGNQKGLRYNFSSRVGTSQPTALPNMLNTQQYMQLYEEAWVNDGNVGTPVLPGNRVSWEDAKNINTNWVDQTVHTGFKQKYDFNVAKGEEKYNFYAGLSYQNDDSYLIGNSYQRISGRVNVDYKFSQKFSVGLSTSLSQGLNNRVDAAWSGGLGAAMSTALPIYPIYYAADEYDDQGNLVAKEGDYWVKAGINNNPVAQRELKSWQAREIRSLNNISMEYKATPNFIVRFRGGYDYMDFEDNVFEKPGYDPLHINDSTKQEQGRAWQYPYWVNNATGNLTASYLYDVNENHHFNFLVGSEYQYSKTGRYNEFKNDIAFSPIDEDPTITNDPTWSQTEFAFASFFARANYNYRGKYLAEALFRTDGSSKFGENYKYGYFPAVSVGWILTEENFLKDNKTVSFLKLKTSLGVNGNSNIPDYQWNSQYSVVNNGYNNQTYIYPVRRENPDLRWEKSTTYDVAVEYGLFGDRITGEIAYYYKKTNDMLLNVTLQKSTGFSNWWDNVGSVFNTGVEFAVKSRNLVGQLTWTTDFNIARNYNEITSIGEYTEDAVSGGTNDTRVVVGSPIGTNYLVRFSRVDAETGRPVYLDINGNETFTWSPNDRVAVGQVLPDAVGGITNTFGYKNWEFGFLFVFTIGGNIYDSSSKRQLGVVTDWNMRTDLFDRWQEPGDNTVYPRLTRETLTYGSGTPWINTDQWLHDASYMRLRNVSLSYNMPRRIVEKWNLTGMRLTVYATNLLTFTNYIGLDPEIARDFENATDRNMSPNISYLTPPQEKTFNLGVDITF